MSPRRKKTVVRGRGNTRGRSAAREKKDGAKSRASEVLLPSYQPKTELEEIAQRYQDLFEFAPVAYVNITRSGRIEETNHAATHLLARQRHLLVGCPFSVVVLPEDSLLFFNHLLRCRTGTGPIETELRLRILKKNILFVRLISMPLSPGQHDGAQVFQTAIFDFTARKEAEKALQESEARFREFAENSTDVFWIINGLTRRMEYLNPVYEEIFGESRRYLMRDLGRWTELIHPEDRANGAEMLERLLAGETMTVEYRIIRPNDRAIRWIRDTGFPIRDQNRAVTRVAGVLQDITVEKAQRAETEQLARLIELSFEPIFVWGFTRGIIQWNAGAERLYHYTRDEALGRQPHELLKTVRSIPFRQFRDFLMRHGRWTGELRHIAKDGREIVAESRHQLLKLDGREVILETIWDITQRKVLEQAARERARQQAVLYEFVQRRHEAKSLADLYASGLDTIIETIGCERASILIFDEERIMRFVAWRGLSRRYRKIAEGHSPWPPEAIDPEPVCISDIQEAELPKRLKAAIKTEGIGAAAFIPLMINGRLAGKFMIYYGQPHQFTESELTIAVNIGVQLAIGIEKTQAEEALRESEDRLRTLANSVPQIIWTNDSEGKPTYFNDRWFDYTGLTYEQSIRDGGQSLLHPDDAPIVNAKWQKALAAGTTFDGEFRLRGADGEYRWFIGRNIPLKDEQGVLGWFGSATDIHDRKKIESALTESEERFRLLVDGARDYAIFIINPSNVITHWNTGAERVFGWTAEEAIGKSGRLVFTPEDRKQKREEHEIAVAMRNGTANDRRWHLRKDGKRIWVDGVMHRLDDEHSGALRGFAKIARDATSERQAQEELERRVSERTAELQAANAKLKGEIENRSRLEQEILLISEREKRRIGQDLHDSLCQELAATAFFLETQALKLKGRRSNQSKIFSEAAQAVNANVGLARDLARGLHPIELSTAGLGNALRELCYRTNQSQKATCRFIYPRPVRVGDDAVGLNLYRIAQEAVTNAVKHAGASELSISLKRSDSRLFLEIHDNGSGFDGKRTSKGMGVDIMHHRASVIGGRLTVESRKGRGTKVICMLPGR